MNIDASKLLARMKRCEEVTGRTISSQIRRAARLTCVNLAYSVPPFGLNQEAKEKGERAVQNDILRVYQSLTPAKFKHATTAKSFSEKIQTSMNKDDRLRDAILESVGQISVKARSAKSRAKVHEGINVLKAILQNAGGFSKLTVSASVDPAVHARFRNAYGRVQKGVQANTLVPARDLQQYVGQVQQLVGLTKAAWAACALDCNADVGNPLAGFPAWVTRLISGVPHGVSDRSTSGSDPHVVVTNSLPWARSALRPADHAAAIELSREKFYKSLGTEIKAALRATQSAV